MWQYYQPAPGVFQKQIVPEPSIEHLDKGEVIIKFIAGAICGSDIPKFLGEIDPYKPDTGCPGAPLHEVVARVVASKDLRLSEGQRVVGLVRGSRGLSQLITNDASLMVPVHDDLGDIEATIVQPLATVFNAYSSVPSLEGKNVAVLGLGPLGLLFARVAKWLGASRVVGVDRIDRRNVAGDFGLDEIFVGDVRKWSRSISLQNSPDVVVEAIGHRQEHVNDAIEAVRDFGHIIVFGLTEDYYVIPMRIFSRKNLTLWAGSTRDWVRFLDEAQLYLLENRDLCNLYVTDRFSVEDVEKAFELYSRPSEGRLKVALTPP